MNELTVVDKASEWRRMKSLVLDSVRSPITKRVYNMALDEFFGWYGQEPRPGFTKATVNAWRVSLDERGLGSSSIIVRMSAIRKLAVEAMDNGLLAPELAAGHPAREKREDSRGPYRELAEYQTGPSAPERARHVQIDRSPRPRHHSGAPGLRVTPVRGGGMAHVQQRDGRWCIVDLIGKHGRIRTVPMPAWVKVAIDAWTGPASVVDGYIFRPVNRGGRIQGDVLSEKVVWQMLKPHAKAAGVAGIAPHDCRRTCAKFCRAAGGELEQIQLLLGHASVQTTERYLGTKQDLVHAPNDGIRLRVAV